MARIVEHDHRSEVLGQLRRPLGDRDAARGAEDVGMTAGEMNVVEFGQRPVPAAGLETLDLDRRPERDRGLPAQRGERGIAGVVQ